ncbi:small GTP-binding protein, putative [Trichomonas vaginalis G3]|uniref:Small GTP-binding protein, putative n=1 Tax=Trichomonas vaginalis (strain ATCC PRA-98 / G3) TaxID=412133 RepID=A2E2M1_TRIV3|nr:GTPase protein [Trichomonas vaginalis G3]EAY13049.1 small GTP-binding protein, putative [Trichomonas vaginalis G3]KAI5548237.1 GTPase protein [Trichomonas vaginalis G3]|eukprot:XP_001325272.1 small GTP-binding protein [Trichomonas vaginalis G3]
MFEAPFRIATIGESAVGKTSIIRNIYGDRFDNAESSTVGVDFIQIFRKYNGKQITLEIWDTAGQERFRSLVPVYCRNVNAAFAVFDVSQPESYDRLESWIHLFKSVGDDRRLIFIVANKIDLLKENYHVVEDACTWAEERGYQFFAVSAKTGEGIEALIDNVVTALYEHYPKKGDCKQITIEVKDKNSGCC